MKPPAAVRTVSNKPPLRVHCPACRAELEVRSPRSRAWSLQLLLAGCLFIFGAVLLGAAAGVLLAAAGIAVVCVGVLRTSCYRCGRTFFRSPWLRTDAETSPALSIREAILSKPTVAAARDLSREARRYLASAAWNTLICAAVIVFIGMIFWGRSLPLMLATVWNMKWILLGVGTAFAVARR